MHAGGSDYPVESIGYIDILPDRRDKTNFSLLPTALARRHSSRLDRRRRIHDYTRSQIDASTYQVRFRVIMQAPGTISTPL